MGSKRKIMVLTDARLACYDDGTWLVLGLGPFIQFREVGSAIVKEYRIILADPHPRDIQPIDIEGEGEIGRSFVSVGVHLMAPMRLLPFTLFLADIFAPKFGQENGKCFVRVQLGPMFRRLPFLEDVGILQRG